MYLEAFSKSFDRQLCTNLPGHWPQSLVKIEGAFSKRISEHKFPWKSTELGHLKAEVLWKVPTLPAGRVKTFVCLIVGAKRTKLSVHFASHSQVCKRFERLSLLVQFKETRGHTRELCWVLRKTRIWSRLDWSRNEMKCLSLTTKSLKKKKNLGCCLQPL